MIAIVNVGNISGTIYKYEVRINKEIITTFEHDRQKGLNNCLKDAAEAVERQTIENYIKLLSF